MEFRRLGPDDLEPLARVARLAFSNDIGRPADDMLGGIEMERFFGAFDGDLLVGAIGAYTLDMTVPGGGSMPVSGTTLAVVMPTHRRQGILRKLMLLHVEESRESGALAAALWASEAGIYERFGYGRAFDRLDVHIDIPSEIRRTAPIVGTVRLVEGEDALAALREVWNLVRPLRPGRSQRSDDWWTWSVFSDPTEERAGYSPFRFAVVDADGRPAGYVKYRSKLDVPGNFRLRGQVEVEELHAASDAAEAALWSFLIEQDLVTDIRVGNLPVDSIVAWLLADHRTAHRRLVEGGWMRLLDVAGAWEARSFATDGRIALAVSDPLLPDNDGIWELTVANGRGLCRRTEREPDLTIASEAAGATYLGAVTWRQMLASGHVQGSSDSIALADSMFAAAAAPWFDFF